MVAHPFRKILLLTSPKQTWCDTTYIIFLADLWNLHSTIRVKEILQRIDTRIENVRSRIYTYSKIYNLLTIRKKDRFQSTIRLSSSLSIKRLNSHHARILHELSRITRGSPLLAVKRKILAESWLKSLGSRSCSRSRWDCSIASIALHVEMSQIVRQSSCQAVEPRVRTRVAVLIWIPRRLEWPSWNSAPTRPVRRPQQWLPLVYYVAVIRAAVPKRRMKFRGKVCPGEYFIVTWNTAK